MKRVQHALQDADCLLGSKHHGPVVGLRARLDVLHRVLGCFFMDQTNFVDAAHDAPHFREGRPYQVAFGMQGQKPALNFERIDVLRNLLTPAGDEVFKDNMLRDGDSVGRFWPYGIGAKVHLQIRACKGVKSDAYHFRLEVDEDDKPEPMGFEYAATQPLTKHLRCLCICRFLRVEDDGFGSLWAIRTGDGFACASGG